MLNQKILLNWPNSNLKNEEEQRNRQNAIEFIWDKTPEYLKKATFSIDFDEGYITYVIYKTYSKDLDAIAQNKKVIEVKDDTLTKSFKISFKDFLLACSNI